VPMLMHDAGSNSARHALAEHHEMDELVAPPNHGALTGCVSALVVKVPPRFG
jgi:hypothetical protein